MLGQGSQFAADTIPFAVAITGVVVVDRDGIVTHLNAVAATIFDVDTLYRSIESAALELHRNGRTYQVEVAPVYDRLDRQSGHTVVFATVTSISITDRN